MRSFPAARRWRPSLPASPSLWAFDDAVVLGGNVPMDVLAKNVDEYTGTAKTT